VQVSHGAEAAEVQGVVKVAGDGSRVYFIARGVLGQAANAEGSVPVRGAENLYVYDVATAATVFVTDLCSGPGLSGEVGDARCPSSLDQASRNDSYLWTASDQPQSTHDGRFLVFPSYGRLVRGDTDAARDIYRYDAVSGRLDRVSLGEGGYDANGNNDAFDAQLQTNGSGEGLPYSSLQHEMSTRAISEDGSRIVFRSVERLSPQAINRLENVYEWYMQEGWSEGRVSLISTGTDVIHVVEAVISPSGRDLFFTTAAGLAAGDTDGQTDIYDARLGEGFPPVPAERQPCSGDACQGALSAPAPLLVPGSVSQAPGGNFAVPVSKPVVKAKPKPKKVKKKNKKVKKKSKAKAKKSSRGRGR
jgi:hypothetical protein